MTPRNPAVGLDEEYGGASDRSPSGLPALVHQAPCVDRLAFDIGEQRKLESEAFRKPRVFLDRVDRDGDDIRAGGTDVFKT